jgi:glucokinase
MKRAIGIDIGGTKIAAGVISETGVLLQRSEVKSDPSDHENMFKQVVTAVKQVLEGHQFLRLKESALGYQGKSIERTALPFFKTICRGSSFL